MTHGEKRVARVGGIVYFVQLTLAVPRMLEGLWAATSRRLRTSSNAR